VRWLAIIFVLLIAAIQYPMWFGKGGWFQVRELDRSLARARESNAALKSRNEALDADVRDLKTGYEAVEERARSDLGMVRNDEVFFQIQPETAVAVVKPTPSSKSATPVASLKTDRRAAPANGRH
jgi:cell division protein FtsB